MSLCPNPSGGLAIAGFDLETECSTVLDPYTPLWTPGQFIESDPVHISGRAGAIVWAPELGPREWQFSFVIVGEKDPSGDVFDDPWVGLESNINWLTAVMLMPIATNRGLRPSVLTMPSGEERYADILVRPPLPGVVSVGDNGTCSAEAGTGESVYARYTFTIFIPSGLYLPA